MSSSPLSQACQRCFTRKKKCDRQKPQCSECLRASVTCEPRIWGRVLSASGEDGIPVESGHVGQLRHKLASLQAKLETFNTTQNSALSGVSPATVTGVSPSVTKNAMTDLIPQNHGSNGREVEYLSLTAMSGPGNQSWTSKQDFSHITAQILMYSGSSTITPVPIPATNHPAMSLPALDPIWLDSKVHGRLTTLIQSCLTHDCTQFIILQHELLEKALQILSSSPSTMQAFTTISPEDLTFVMATASLNSLSLSREATDDALLAHSVHSMQRMNISLLADSGLMAVQSLAIQASLACHFQSASLWHTLGLAFTKAISIGLHNADNTQDLNIDGRPSKSDIFWSLYVLDRAVSFSMGRPFSIQDDDISLKGPDLQDYAPVTEPRALALIISAWTVRHARMLSSWMTKRQVGLRTLYQSYIYWQDTMYDMVDHAVHLNHSNGTFWENQIRKNASQLNCRALFQLAHKAISYKENQSCLAMTNTIETELLSYIRHMEACSAWNSRFLTIIDGYDVFNAFLLFIYHRIYSNPHRKHAILGVSHMKMLMSANQLLQELGKRFSSMLGLKDLLWTLLSTLESLQEQNFASNVIAEALMKHQSDIAACPASISGPANDFMLACLRGNHLDSTAN